MGNPGGTGNPKFLRALERRPRYLIYARGLIGGGWAALYFTTYAAHALDAARVVEEIRERHGIAVRHGGLDQSAHR